MIHPAITADKPFIHYNAVHMSAPRPIEIVLTNPTQADAQWVLVEEGEEAKFGPLEASVALDQPPATRGAFTVSPGRGVLRGSGMEIPKQQRVKITMHPTTAGTVTQRLRFAVRKGRGCTVHVTGDGVYDEHQEHNIKLATLR
eukprot:scaffold106439_cov31-Prasinocladus_malaysianus.AAC.1